MRCKKHPQYEAKRAGRSGCLKCWLIFWLVRRGWVGRPVVRRRKKLTPRQEKLVEQFAATPAPKIEHPPLPGIETATPADVEKAEKAGVSL
jgi:hypothetical protein